MGLFSRFVAKIKGESTASALDWDELSAELLAADLGPVLTEEVIAQAKKIKGDDAEGSLREILTSHLSSKDRAIAPPATPAVILVVGVNGVGKTTSVAKLAHYLQKNYHSLVLGAADTFRAAAVDQLSTWGARVGVEVITGKHEGEPASVAFDTVKGQANSVRSTRSLIQQGVFTPRAISWQSLERLSESLKRAFQLQRCSW